MELIDASGLEDAIALHVHEMLARVFAWHDGTYAFEEEPEGGPGEELTLKLSTGRADSRSGSGGPRPGRGALRPRRHGPRARALERPAAALPEADLVRRRRLRPLSRVDGVTSAREIVQMIPLPAEQTQRSLLGLLSTGVVEYAGVRRPRDASAPARPAPDPAARGARRTGGARPATAHGHATAARGAPAGGGPRSRRRRRRRPAPGPSTRRQRSAAARSSRRGRGSRPAPTSRCSGSRARSARPR